MYSTIPIRRNIKPAPASPGRSRVGPALYVCSLLGVSSCQSITVQVPIHNLAGGGRSVRAKNVVSLFQKLISCGRIKIIFKRSSYIEEKACRHHRKSLVNIVITHVVWHGSAPCLCDWPDHPKNRFSASCY
jgi:hypothetical protein